MMLLIALASFAQKAIIYHNGEEEYVVAPHTYSFDISDKKKFLVTISDSIFLQFLDSVVTNAVVDDSCSCTTHISHDMIRIIYEKNDHKYYTINMTHYGYPYDYHAGCLEIDGQIMRYDSLFQIIVDNIVNYYIHYHPNKSSFQNTIRAILKGKRYNFYASLPPSSM